MCRLRLVMAMALGVGALLSGGAYAQTDAARSKGAAWLVKQQRGDGSWANADGEQPVQATSTALFALRKAGLSRSPTLGTAVSWLGNADTDSIDSIARKAEALALNGLAASSQAEADKLYALRTQSGFASWGGYGGPATDFVDTALGLAALRTADGSYASKLLTTVLAAYCEAATSRVAVSAGKQAWPLTKPATNQSAMQGRPSVLATALMLGEMRALQLQPSGFASASCPSTYAVATLVSEAQAWLLDQQNADGGFGEQRSDGSKGSSSALVTAVVLRAFNSLTTVPPQAVSAQTWLLGQQDSATGSWRGDAMVTAMVLGSLPAAAGGQLTDTDGDGITDVVEAYVGSNPSVADARNPLTAPGLGTPGSNSTAFIAGATVGQSFSYTLSSGSSYALTAGSLPPGLSLNGGTGMISGTPSTAGSYAFDYLVSGGSSPLTVIGRIDVAQAGGAGEASEDAPIPLWALAVLGAGLLRLSLRRGKS